MPERFFRYIPPTDDQWGLQVVDCGWSRIPPDSPYPPVVHPGEYTLSAEAGRVLQEGQIVYITRGRGVFRSEASEQVTVEAGTIILLFPGIRHWYRPVASVGWDEYWVGLTGPLTEHLWHKAFTPDHPVHAVGQSQSLIGLYQAIFDLVEHEAFGFRPIIAAKALEIAARAHTLAQGARPPAEDRIIQEACSFMAEHLDQAIDFHAYAQDSRLSYSSFRRLFKARTGLAPTQYLLDLRLQKAKRLLTNTTLPVQTIAPLTGFQSAFYFSRYFKQHTGTSPRAFRNQFQ